METEWKKLAEAPISELTRHDHYAAHALQGLLAAGVIYDRLTHTTRKELANTALMLADAVIDALEGGPEA